MTKKLRAIRLTDEVWACVVSVANQEGRSAQSYVERLLSSLCGPTAVEAVEDTPQPVAVTPVEEAPTPPPVVETSPMVVGGITLKGTRRNPDEWRKR